MRTSPFSAAPIGRLLVGWKVLGSPGVVLRGQARDEAGRLSDGPGGSEPYSMGAQGAAASDRLQCPACRGMPCVAKGP